MKLIPLHNQLSPRQKAIYNILQKHENATNKMLLEKCSAKFGNISRITLIRDCNDLMRRKYIIRHGRGRGVTYQAQKQREVEKSYQHIPPFLKKYFWDTDFGSLSTKKHATWIIERILEFGNQEAINWLREVFPERMIISVLDHSRRISDKSWNFWKLIFSSNNFLPLCTRRHSKKTQEKIWRY